jgi:ketosteroid isomerase-like protein
MRRILNALALLGAAVFGPGCGPQTGTMTLTLARDGDLTFEVDNGLDTYPVTLTAGEVAIDSINLIDELSPFATPFLTTPGVFDFVTEDAFVVGPVTLRPKGFQQLHFFFDNADSGALAGLTLRLAADITLTDGSTATLTATLSLDERDSQEVLAAIPIFKRDNTDIEVAFDHKLLLAKIDFDALASASASGVITLSQGTGDPAIDLAVEALRRNLFRVFRFDGPTAGGGD